MTEKNYNNWRKVSGILFLIMITGFTAALLFPRSKLETTGVSFILFAYLGSIISAGKTGFDNKPLWRVLSLLFPYIILPFMLCRTWERVNSSAEKNSKKIWEAAKNDLIIKVEKIVKLKEKSTMSSLMQAGRMESEILDADNNWQPLCDMALNSGISTKCRKEIISLVARIQNNDFTDIIMEKLKNDPDPTIKTMMKELDVVTGE